jgi:hypothetical protein
LFDQLPPASSTRDRPFPTRMFGARTPSPGAHYLKAVQAAGSEYADAVMAKMREMPINDFMTHDLAPAI